MSSSSWPAPPVAWLVFGVGNSHAASSLPSQSAEIVGRWTRPSGRLFSSGATSGLKPCGSGGCWRAATGCLGRRSSVACVTGCLSPPAVGASSAAVQVHLQTTEEALVEAQVGVDVKTLGTTEGRSMTVYLRREEGVWRVALEDFLTSSEGPFRLGWARRQATEEAPLPAYRAEPRVVPDSRTETFVALIAACTGSGEAGLYWGGTAHRPFATEGGHAPFAPSDGSAGGALPFPHAGTRAHQLGTAGVRPRALHHRSLSSRYGTRRRAALVTRTGASGRSSSGGLTGHTARPCAWGSSAPPCSSAWRSSRSPAVCSH